jgi:low temperature requirement protein LtrA
MTGAGGGERRTTAGGWPELARGRASELLLDLVYVFVLTRFSVRLIEDFTTDRRIVITEVGQTAILLLALWLVWVEAAWVTSRFDPQDPVIQLVITWIMFGSMIIAVPWTTRDSASAGRCPGAAGPASRPGGSPASASPSATSSSS